MTQRYVLMPQPNPDTGSPQPQIGRTRPLTVIYLAGHGRCGSTILGKVLGELDGAAYVGELNFFWSDGVLGDRPCGCGLSLETCPKWSAVLARLGDRRLEMAARATELMSRTTRLRHGLLALTPVGRRRMAAAVAELAGYLDELYLIIAEEFGVDVIVDSSKSPMYARLLDAAPTLRVEKIHLVRDPRAAAHSWARPKSEAVGGRTLPTIGPVHSAVEWTAINLLTMHATRHATEPVVRVGYEELMSDPGSHLARIGQALGRDTSGLQFSEDGTIALGTSHSVAGNPDRFATGTVTLRPDNRWQTAGGRRDRALVTALSLPALRRLGYSLRVRGPR